MMMPPASIFEGTGAIIARFLGLKPGELLKHRSVCRRLSQLSRSPPVVEGLVSAIYSQIEENWSGRTPSGENWRLEPQTTIGAANTSPEVLLERAIAILAKRGVLEGWYNQIPVASGLVDHKSDKRAAIDLLRIEHNRVDLVELKWQSDTPSYAAFEILRYGLAYLFAAAHKSELGYFDKQVLTANRASLMVLAPAPYFQPLGLGWLGTELDRQLQVVARHVTGNALKMRFQFCAFPDRFQLPFKRGEQVKALGDLPAEAPACRCLVDAMTGITQVWPSMEAREE